MSHARVGLRCAWGVGATCGRHTARALGTMNVCLNPNCCCWCKWFAAAFMPCRTDRTKDVGAHRAGTLDLAARPPTAPAVRHRKVASQAPTLARRSIARFRGPRPPPSPPLPPKCYDECVQDNPWCKDDGKKWCDKYGNQHPDYCAAKVRTAAPLRRPPPAHRSQVTSTLSSVAVEL